MGWGGSGGVCKVYVWDGVGVEECVRCVGWGGSGGVWDGMGVEECE